MDFYLQLLIDAVFHRDLKNRSSDKFVAMEDNIKTSVRKVRFVFFSQPSNVFLF